MALAIEFGGTVDSSTDRVETAHVTFAVAGRSALKGPATLPWHCQLRGSCIWESSPQRPGSISIGC